MTTRTRAWTPADRLTLGVFAIIVPLVMLLLGRRFLATEVSPDFLEGYFSGALSLRAGTGYLDVSGQLITHWPPGLSLFLAPWVQPDLDSTLSMLLMPTALLIAAWVYLLGGLSRRIVPGLPLWVTLPPMTLWPPLIPLGNPTGSELLFGVLVAAALLIVVDTVRQVGNRVAHWALAGVTLGGAALTKTIGLPITMAIVGLLLLGWGGAPWGRRFLQAGALAAGMMLIVAPWVLVYHRHTGEFGFTSAGAWSIMDGLRRYPHLEAGQVLIAESDNWRVAGDIRRSLVGVAIAYPGSLARLTVEKALRPWYATDSGRLDRRLLLPQMFWLVAFLLALRSARDFRAPSQDLGMLLVVVVVAVWASATSALSIFRYMAPIFPFVVLICVRSWGDWWAKGPAATSGDDNSSETLTPRTSV